MHRHNLAVLRFMLCGLLGLAGAGCFPKDRIEDVSPGVHTVDLSGTCLTVKEYAPGELASLGDAIAQLPNDSPIISAMGDYKRMRDQSRACHKTAGK